MSLPTPSAHTLSQITPYRCMYTYSYGNDHQSFWLYTVMYNVNPFPIDISQYTTMDHFRHATIQVHPQWLPNSQPSPLPQVPLVFPASCCGAPPAIQANLPGSLDAILYLGNNNLLTSTSQQYCLITHSTQTVFHPHQIALYPRGFHTQGCNKYSKQRITEYKINK